MISTHKPTNDPLLQNSRLLIDAIWSQFQEFATNYKITLKTEKYN